MEWVALFRRLAKTRYGLNSELMRYLYRIVGIPKITYAADVWYEPLRILQGKKKRTGSVTALVKLQQVQRAAATAIAGALKATAGDTLDVHADLTPIEILLETQHKRAYIRLCTLPSSHVLNLHTWAAHKNRENWHNNPYPLTVMAHMHKIPPDAIEKI